METIFALASAQGKAGVSVIRLSGPRSFDVGRALCGTLPEPRLSAVRVLSGPDGGFLDQALVLCFEAGASFTGEETVEFHVHGSVAVVRAVLACLSEMDGLRLAEAGEFTRRALENDRLDLAQVEALSDLIESETEAQRVQALRLFSGALGQKVESWRAELLHAVALLEATIDFADEEVPVDVTEDVLSLLGSVSLGLGAELDGFSAAEKIRSGFEVAIVGPPNAGKSTLLNYLVQRDVAIVSSVAGTTRDVIEVSMDLDGLSVVFLDTAGIRETDDVVERIGVDRALARAEAADLRVHLVGSDERPPVDVKPVDLVVLAKQDSGEGVSGVTGNGVPGLLDAINARLQERVAGAGLVSRERHRVALALGLESLQEAKSLVSSGPEAYDIASEEVRTSIRRLESLVGLIDVEDVLGQIFSSFCVGK